MSGKTVLDHIVVTAPDLDTGCEYVEQCLGVAPQAGGEHPRMGTHNRLLRLGPACYLEVIAINPVAPAPGVARWFDLDALKNSPPRLSSWVVRSNDIQATLHAAALPLGVVQSMQRGTLDWLITIAADGKPALAGMAPAVIQWQTPSLPVLGMPEQGLVLEQLELSSPQADSLSDLIQRLALDAPVVVRKATPGLKATIRGPRGLCTLGG